jgi:hypothetical protein
MSKTGSVIACTSAAAPSGLLPQATDRLRAENQIRSLASELTTAEQAERHRLSQILHGEGLVEAAIWLASQMEEQYGLCEQFPNPAHLLRQSPRQCGL